MAQLRQFAAGGNFYIVWRDTRSRRLSTGTGDPEEARRQLARFEARLGAPPEGPTVGELIEAYLESLKDRRWIANRRYEMRAVAEHFGRVPPELVSAALVRGFMVKRTRAGAGRATVDRQLRALRACLAWAVKQGWIERAPHIESPGGNPPRERWLSREEAGRLLAACGAPHIRLFVLLALHSGARTGAILDLTWDRVDLRRGRLLYPPADPRSRKRTAVVPLTPTLAAALAEARAFAQSDWVIEYNGGPVAAIKTGFRAAVRRARLAHVTPHDLRRTCATWLVADGVPLAKVARFLGDSEEMIEKVYGQHGPDYLKAAARSLEG